MKLKLDASGHAVLENGNPVYIHADGKEVAHDAAHTVATITRLNSEAKTNRERAETAETKLKSFDGITDAEAAKKALDTVKNIDDKKLVDAGKVEELKAGILKAAKDSADAAARTHAEELGKLKVENEKVTGLLYAEKIGGSFTRSKLISEKFAIPADIVQARFGGNFRIEEGKVVAYDSSGNKIFSRSKPGEVAEFDEALETLVDAYPYKDQILKGTTKPGGGAPNNQGGAAGGKQVTRAQFDAMDHSQRSEFAKANGKVID